MSVTVWTEPGFKVSVKPSGRWVLNPVAEINRTEQIFPLKLFIKYKKQSMIDFLTSTKEFSFCEEGKATDE